MARYPADAAATDEGLTPELAKAIKADAFFARDAGGMLYVFEDGVYDAGGRRYVEKRVKQLVEALAKTKAWNPELSARVEAWLLVDAPELWERPSLDTLNVKNGFFLDVNSRTLRAHSREYLSPVQIPVTFDPDATCPAIERFVSETFPSRRAAPCIRACGVVDAAELRHSKIPTRYRRGAQTASQYI